VLTHELGHVLGYHHGDGAMTPTLEPGDRDIAVTGTSAAHVAAAQVAAAQVAAAAVAGTVVTTAAHRLPATPAVAAVSHHSRVPALLAGIGRSGAPWALLALCLLLLGAVGRRGATTPMTA
jgi:hypothetical protein